METLNILEGFDLSEYGAGTPAAVHRIAEAMKLAFADRAAYLGDPDFVDVPTHRLVSKSYADALRARIDPPWWSRWPWEWGDEVPAIRVEGPGLPVDDSGTTHLSTSDAAGNLVALTMTINTPFGSGITVPGTGIVLNNEMDDFAVAPDTPNAYGLVDTTGNNAVAPGKRPLSSMTPTLLLKRGKPFMVAGSPGGPRIITTTLLTILNVVDFGMDVQQAVAAPRFHHQWQPDTLFLEPDPDPALVEGLRERGHTLEVGPRRWSASEAIVIDPASGVQSGGSDPRTDGAALGWDGAALPRAPGLGLHHRLGVRVQPDDAARHAQHVLGAHRGDALRVGHVGLGAEAVASVQRDLRGVHRVALLVDHEVPDQVAARALQLLVLGRPFEQALQLGEQPAARLVEPLRRGGDVGDEVAGHQAFHRRRAHRVGEAPACRAAPGTAARPGRPAAGRSPPARSGRRRPR